MSYFERMIEDIRRDGSLGNLVRNIVTPFASYYIADHYYGDEVPAVFECKKETIPDGNNLFINNNIETIKDYDIIQVKGSYSYNGEVNFFKKFIYEILPKINKKIILVTTFIYEEYKEESNIIFDNENIILWFSYNQGVANFCGNSTFHKKMRPFPFGICIVNNSLEKYRDVLLDNSISKDILLIHMHLGPNNRERKIFPPGQYEKIESYYKKIKGSKFIISPAGDMPDCYRHWEAIGLGCIPISGISYEAFYWLFGENMYFVRPGDDKDYPPLTEKEKEILDESHSYYRVMVKFIEDPSSLECKYKEPNRDLVTIEYWKDYIKSEVFKLISEI